MGISNKLNKTLRTFIERQQVFFVGTAAADGRVNISPKGLSSLRILSDTRIVWLNLSGSGNETAAHVRELPRMTLMFCAMEGDPLTLRVYGNASVWHPDEPSWGEMLDLFPPMAGSRQIFDLEIDLAQTSCGTGVPFYEFKGQRGETELVPYYDQMGTEWVKEYWQRKNKVSIDGKPTGL